MAKRLSILNGWAILAVVCNHATNWGYIAMFWWVDRYRPVTAPNFDQLGTAAYYSLAAIQDLTLFCVPAFLFASGFFVAYAARGEGGITWKMVRARISRLLWPYLIWSTVMFVDQALQGNVYSPVEYVRRILTGGALPPYFFVPVLCQFYLLSRLIVRLAKERPRLLLGTTATVQLLSISLLMYLQLNVKDLSDSVFQKVGWLSIWFAFYFPFGVVAGLRWSSVHALMVRFKWVWVVMTIVLGIVSVFEDSWLRQVTQTPPSWQATTFSSNIYAMAFLFAFLSLSGSQGRSSQALSWLGARSYGIYLVHFPLLSLIARFIRRVIPALLSQQSLLVFVLAVAVVGIVTMAMEAIVRSPVRNAHRYLFG